MSNVYKLNGPAELTGDMRDGHPVARIGDLTAKWSNPKFLPKIGERLEITFNGFGAGKVLSYFIEDGWLGVEVEVDKRPDWHVKQNGSRHVHPLVFGAEIRREGGGK